MDREVYLGPNQNLLEDDIAYACMHQRMGFYIAPSARLLAVAYYGIAPEPRTSPCRGDGVGRAVREVFEDGSLGPIHFVLYNENNGFDATNSAYPYYKASGDSGFVEACDALLADKLVVMQWWEENRDCSDPGFFATRDGHEAFNYYRLKDGRIIGLWKHSLVTVSEDVGKSWAPARRCSSLVMSGGKVWGQETSDGRYTLLYNPSGNGCHRWPLALVTSDDGLDFSDMVIVSGEVPPRRYYGRNKDYGLNYVRGMEMEVTPPDGDLYVVYSMNKEDMWISRVPVPIRSTVVEHVDDDFNDMTAGAEVVDWNIYSPQWARVSVEEYPSAADKSLRLRCKDPADYAKAERIFPESDQVTVIMRVSPFQARDGELQIDVVDHRESVAARLVFDSDGVLKVRTGGAPASLLVYARAAWYDITIRADCYAQSFAVSVNGSRFEQYRFITNCPTVERVVFRTGAVRRRPTIDDYPEDDTFEMPDSEEPLARESIYFVNRLQTSEGV